MSAEQFDNEKSYMLALRFACTLKDKGLLTEEEFAVIDTKLLEKYRPKFGALFSENAC